MSIIKKALIFCAPKKEADPTVELAKIVAGMTDSQARLVLSFVKNLFGPELSPDGHTNAATEEYDEERRVA